jgi:glutamine synthetase
MTLSPAMAGLPRDRAAEESVLDQVGRSAVQLVDLQFSDITGGAKSLTIPAGLLAQTLAHGYRFDGAALTGGVRQLELDLYLVPDPATLAFFPPLGVDRPAAPGEQRRARLYCSVHRRDGQPFAGDPRSTLQRTLEAASAAGFDYRVGIEIEYYLLRRDPTELGLLPEQPGGAGYFDLGEDLIAGTRDEIVATLQAVGVGIGGAHHETGPGQEELDLLATGGIKMADQIMTVRQVIRSVAQRRGLRATFMPKPLVRAPGSGMHVVQRLARFPQGGDVLRAPESRDDLSPVARQLIAGQLAHAAGICAVVCPTVNSYKRLAAGHRAPRHAFWARFGQAALVRVPAWAADEDAMIELRCPDAMANPYLAFAAVLACALDGIRLAEEPPLPLEQSLITYEDEELARLGIPLLPATLGDALHALAEDDVLRAALGDYIFDQLLTVKRAEWEDYRRYVSPWEHARYADV